MIQVMHRLGQINHKVASLGHHDPKSKAHADSTAKKLYKSPKAELFRKVFDMSEHINEPEKKKGSISSY